MKMEGLKATARQLATVLERSAEVGDCPERRLVLAVLAQALLDADGGRSVSSGDCRDARAFFIEGQHSPWCEAIGLDPDYVRELVARHAVWWG